MVDLKAPVWRHLLYPDFADHVTVPRMVRGLLEGPCLDGDFRIPILPIT